VPLRTGRYGGLQRICRLARGGFILWGDGRSGGESAMSSVWRSSRHSRQGRLDLQILRDGYIYSEMTNRRLLR